MKQDVVNVLASFGLVMVTVIGGYYFYHWRVSVIDERTAALEQAILNADMRRLEALAERNSDKSPDSVEEKPSVTTASVPVDVTVDNAEAERVIKEATAKKAETRRSRAS